MTAQSISATEFLSNNNNEATIIDLRTPAEVSRENIDNCICLPLQTLTPESLHTKLHDRLNKKTLRVFLLCQSGMRAHAAVRQLGVIKGIEWVVIEGGLNAIKTAGGTVNCGAHLVIPLERQVRIAAGVVILTGVLLGSFLNSAFFLLSGFVGVGLIFAGVTDRCGLAFLLTRMPWNQ
ncbi:rhodanese-related sulfurtransferase [Alteromonadaceae bacterium 2753L.S.0a.02]|nr:rhodanese-related sulfurtransferase [Alteromonadaceae bacterium 2753L.S.0a.02]